jgi:plastocyanin
MPFKTIVFFGLLASGPFLPAHAAVTNITYGSFFFDPKVVTINVGDTVVWTNGSGSHTVLGTDSDPMCGGTSLPCAHTFNTPGTYDYQCTVLGHAASGMTGTIIVTSPSTEPAQLTNPMRLPDGRFQFTIISTANRTNIVQASTDLSSSTNWISLSTIIPSTNIFTFTDTNAGGLRLRFYRIVEPQ